MRLNKSITCADGFSMSVQAHRTAYCTPRENFAASYSHVEVGYPSDYDSVLIKYAEDPDKPTMTVYGYVPKEIVTLVILNHGGVAEGQLPNGFCIDKLSSNKLNNNKS